MIANANSSVAALVKNRKLNFICMHACDRTGRRLSPPRLNQTWPRPRPHSSITRTGGRVVRARSGAHNSGARLLFTRLMRTRDAHFLCPLWPLPLGPSPSHARALLWHRHASSEMTRATLNGRAQVTRATPLEPASDWVARFFLPLLLLAMLTELSLSSALRN